MTEKNLAFRFLAVHVVGIVLRDAMAKVLARSLVGFFAALALTRLASTFLYGMTPRDPATFVLAKSAL